MLRDLQVQPAQQVLRVHKAFRDQQVTPEQQAQQVLRVRKAFRVQQEMWVRQEQLARKVRRVNLAQLVLMDLMAEPFTAVLVRLPAALV